MYSPDVNPSEGSFILLNSGHEVVPISINLIFKPNTQTMSSEFKTVNEEEYMPRNSLPKYLDIKYDVINESVAPRILSVKIITLLGMIILTVLHYFLLRVNIQ